MANKINTQEHPLFGKGKHRIHSDAVNHEFRRKLWDGQLPLKINVHYKEVSTSKRIRSLYVMVPRLNYFTFILERVKAAFDEYVAADLVDNFDEMWFEYNNSPLRWDVPIGVQFDTLVGFGDEGVGQDGKSRELPWQIVFHYKSLGEDQSRVKLIKNGPVIGIKYMEFCYVNSLKESHVLRMGSANEILAQMKKYEEEKLLDGIQKHNYELFWEINQPLNDKHIADMKKFAIRVYSNKYINFVQPNAVIEPYQDAGSDPTKIDIYSDKFVEWEQKSYNQTIGQLLLKQFPRLFEQKESPNGSVVQKKPFDIICHGLKVNLETPLYWLQLNMSYLDNFVYISFRSRV